MWIIYLVRPSQTDQLSQGRNSAIYAYKRLQSSKKLPSLFHPTSLLYLYAFNDMHTVAAPAKVLVTGANGFIAVWVVKYLLEKGYTVRGTVRSEAKGEHLLKLFKNYVDAGNFELVTVSDFTKPGAFDEAVKGMDVIEHTASPFHFNVSF